jgi:hypothetical protein
MQSTLFLYIDILGFSDLIKDISRVEHLYKILDNARLHRDSNYRAIVFSDTIIVYHTHSNLTGTSKATELMFLIELTQELFLRLVGSGIFFRAVITEGSFHHKKLKNLEAFYGQALVDTYRAEKSIPSIGLFLENKLRKFNQVFRWRIFSPQFDFIYLTHQCTCLTPTFEESFFPSSISNFNPFVDPEFPLPGLVLTSSGSEFLIYPEIIHFREVYNEMNNHPDPNVRTKHLAAWNMYCLGYPKLMKSLVDHEFAPEGLAELDWTEIEQRFEQESVNKINSSQ